MNGVLSSQGLESRLQPVSAARSNDEITRGRLKSQQQRPTMILHHSVPLYVWNPAVPSELALVLKVARFGACPGKC